MEYSRRPVLANLNHDPQEESITKFKCVIKGSTGTRVLKSRTPSSSNYHHRFVFVLGIYSPPLCVIQSRFCPVKRVLKNTEKQCKFAEHFK